MLYKHVVAHVVRERELNLAKKIRLEDPGHGPPSKQYELNTWVCLGVKSIRNGVKKITQSHYESNLKISSAL